MFCDWLLTFRCQSTKKDSVTNKDEVNVSYEFDDLKN